MDRLRVLFLCTHNSARSQMAEALLRSIAGERFEVASAVRDAIRARLRSWLEVVSTRHC